MDRILSTPADQTGLTRYGFLFFMRLIVNGEIFETSNAGTIMELLNELRIEPGQVAVEVNLSIIKKVAYSTFRLNNEDKIEIVNFVGGG
ncbi:MAG: sulfur carrier protein ThiS [Nitrospirota bacterium]|nr:sulfur carrier protein ThiS [Nitrospirota bacterium]